MCNIRRLINAEILFGIVNPLVPDLIFNAIFLSKPKNINSHARNHQRVLCEQYDLIFPVTDIFPILFVKKQKYFRFPGPIASVAQQIRDE